MSRPEQLLGKPMKIPGKRDDIGSSGRAGDTGAPAGRLVPGGGRPPSARATGGPTGSPAGRAKVIAATMVNVGSRAARTRRIPCGNGTRDYPEVRRPAGE
jgi:hypothetical protein